VLLFDLLYVQKDVIKSSGVHLLFGRIFVSAPWRHHENYGCPVRIINALNVNMLNRCMNETRSVSAHESWLFTTLHIRKSRAKFLFLTSGGRPEFCTRFSRFSSPLQEISNMLPWVGWPFLNSLIAVILSSDAIWSELLTVINKTYINKKKPFAHFFLRSCISQSLLSRPKRLPNKNTYIPLI
jgi:hypothetical protein